MPNQYTGHPPAEIRFWRLVDPCRTDGCAIWLGAKDAKGYGRFRFNGKTSLAHHFLIGKPETGFNTDHLCRVPSCVWPEHLEVVTSAENTRRGVHWQRVKTHCKRGHPFSEENTFYILGRYRQCRICARKRKAEWQAAHS